MSEWKITIDPRAKDSPHGSLTVAYLPDRESAEIDAVAYAELIEASGYLPSSYEADPANHIPGGVVRRVGRSTWLIRTDTFEFERDDGYDNGFGYLRVREA